MTMKAWMIRRKGGFLYSTAGSSPRFKSRGKVFYRYADLMCHLKYFARWHNTPKGNPYIDCEIVEFNLSEDHTKDISKEVAIINL